MSPSQAPTTIINTTLSSTLLFVATIISSIALTKRIDQQQQQDEHDAQVEPQQQQRGLQTTTSQSPSSSPTLPILQPSVITIAYATTTNTCRNLANSLHSHLSTRYNGHIQITPISSIDWWDELLNPPSRSSNPSTLLLIIPTWSHGQPPPSAAPLLSSLRDISTDWRVAPKPLSRVLRVAVFGIGSSAYDPHTFGKPAKEAWKLLMMLGARGLGGGVGMGDVEVPGGVEKGWDGWMDKVERDWDNPNPKRKKNGKKTIKRNNRNVNEENTGGCGPGGEVMDLEDLGHEPEENETSTSEPPEMVTASQAKALKKEGYKLIGSHSAVKLCRWTKHQLRGRGGCYKHTFYGITSYQCMEATPSLACANKCVFCWRHHKNPVGKEWRWKTDSPSYIVETAINTHIQMIKETKGIPGVLPSRYEAAHTVRHCALSLVGEPIMYPHINTLLSELHKRDISSFLVTNGQHPDAIDTLIPVTQLYVSVDAPNETSLIEIDRPLFQDAYERLKRSLTSLKARQQRTVARLTVVKGWNADDIDGYANLIALGGCSLVEIKGVTYCGKSDASDLTMSNTPWHHEVVALAKRLMTCLNVNTDWDYGLASEHVHSCSVLLARKDLFWKQERWMTWINYDVFQELMRRKDIDPGFEFGVEDYIAETPRWAVFGSGEDGFDPTDTRVYKKKKKYTAFDEDGVPTKDHEGKCLGEEERRVLRTLMEEKRKELEKAEEDVGSSNEEKKGGREVVDVSLMFRGMVLGKDWY